MTFAYGCTHSERERVLRAKMKMIIGEMKNTNNIGGVRGGAGGGGGRGRWGQAPQ